MTEFERLFSHSKHLTVLICIYVVQLFLLVQKRQFKSHRNNAFIQKDCVPEVSVLSLRAEHWKLHVNVSATLKWTHGLMVLTQTWTASSLLWTYELVLLCTSGSVSWSSWCWRGAGWQWWRISSSAGDFHLRRGRRRRREFTVGAPEPSYSEPLIYYIYIHSLICPLALIDMDLWWTHLKVRQQCCRLKYG